MRWSVQWTDESAPCEDIHSYRESLRIWASVLMALDGPGDRDKAGDNQLFHSESLFNNSSVCFEDSTGLED